MTFRILSLVLLGAAFMASQAGADKSAPRKPVAKPAQAILEEIQKVDEVHEINKSKPSVAIKATLTDSLESPQVSKKN